VDPGEQLTFTHTFAATRGCDITPGFFIRRGDRVVTDTTYARMLGRPLHLSAGETRTLRWSMSMHLPAGVYEVGCHLGDIEGGYHEYTNRLCVVTVGDDPRVKGDSYVGLKLEEACI